MSFQSILGRNKLKHMGSENIVMPRYFYDFNLDQIILDIMDEQKLYDLRRFYYNLSENVEDINYRIDVLKEFDNERIYQSIHRFCIDMRNSREYLANIELTDIKEQKQKWKLDSAYSYINGTKRLYNQLGQETLVSEGFKKFYVWLDEYINSQVFMELSSNTEILVSKLNKMTFNIRIKRDRMIINQGYLEDDYGKQMKETFRDKSEEEHYYQKNPFGTVMMSAMEESILNVLRRPYAQVFDDLDKYDKSSQEYIHEMLGTFEQECQFYLSFYLYRKRMMERGFHFCYPEINEADAFGACQLSIIQGYDLALAKKNAMLKKEVVLNDCYLKHNERFFVITGPNQGGKTTFARALGQILYFGLIGLMVPCTRASFPFFDKIISHFAVEENPDTGAGKLKEELIRLKDLMNNVTQESFIIINEVFASATSYDANIMGRKVIDFFMEKNCRGVYVTHIYELANNDERLVSLVASVLSEDSNLRTYRIERRPADGRSYSNTIVEKHNMTYEKIKKRISYN